MKKISKILAVLLSVVIFMSIVPITASAATYTGKCGANVTWSYNTSTYTLTISGTGAIMYDDYGNYPWDSYKQNIKKVVINSGVTTISDFAFEYCYSLKSVTIPDSVTTIGGWAFRYCDSLTNITIPDSVTTIGECTFYECDSLTSVIIPDSVTTIDEYAFYGCDSLTSVAIPDSVTTIGSHTFFSCDSLKDVYYSGTRNQWNQISISIGNDSLYNATIHYHVHNYKAVVTPATCEQNGYTTYTCECGDTYVDEYVDALGHADNNNDGKCDNCHKLLGSAQECDCNCHKTGISKFFFDLILFFQMLFGSNEVCDCGVAHY